MSAPAYEIKGRCPGALAPMISGDGLIVRVKPRLGALPVAALAALAQASVAHGNGVIELTRRANVQIRGVRDETLAPLLDRLRALDLIDSDGAVETVRNIVIGPLAGLDPDELVDMRPVANELAQRLAEDPPKLPAKFSFVLDGGGRFGLGDVRADVRLIGIARGRIRVDLHGAALAEVEEDGAARMAMELAHATSDNTRMADCAAGRRAATGSVSRLGVLLLGAHTVVGFGVPFGQLDAAQIASVAKVLGDAHVTELRLSPWRALYAVVSSGPESKILAGRLAELGLMVDDDDPLAGINACPGAPACAAGQAAAREDARRLAATLRARGLRISAHVSGCAKGCAQSSAADLTLVGAEGGYDVIPGGTTRDRAVMRLTADRIDDALAPVPRAAR